MRLKLLPHYTGKNYHDIRQILKDKSTVEILWLEILFNDRIRWEKLLSVSTVEKNYRKAYAWQKNFKSLLESCGIKRKGLARNNGKIDYRDYRKFIEALYYVSQP